MPPRSAEPGPPRPAATAAAPAPTPPAPEPPAPSVGSVTGLTLPRFASIKDSPVNMRAGPGTRFPIEWTYQRRDLPVTIVREHELWRRVRDPEGTEGWVHATVLAGRRGLLVTGQERVLRRRPEEEAPAIARLAPGVIGRVRSCAAGSAWCEVQVGEHRGWLRRDAFFGVGPEEEVR